MKNFSIILLLLLLPCFIYAQTNNNSWYKILQGRIDNKYAVTIHLHNSGPLYKGFYYYDAVQNPIHFVGEDTSKKGAITLVAYASNAVNEAEEFIINKKGDAYTGTWKKKEGSKPLLFAATENKNDSLIQFDYFFTSGSAPLKPSLKKSPEAYYEQSILWPVTETPSGIFLKNYIATALGNKNAPAQISPTIIETKNKVLSNYLSEYKDVADSDLIQMPHAYSLEEMNFSMVMYQSPRLLTIADYSYGYSGGAHGMYGMHCWSVATNSNKKLALQDILNNKGVAALPQLLQKYFKIGYALKPSQPLTDGGLFENEILPNDNFYVTGKGIGFTYNPYEIGPYVMGIIQIFIPFKELQPYMQSSFKTIL